MLRDESIAARRRREHSVPSVIARTANMERNRAEPRARRPRSRVRRILGTVPAGGIACCQL